MASPPPHGPDLSLDLGEDRAPVPPEELASARVLDSYRQQVQQAVAAGGLRGAWRVLDAGRIEAPVIVHPFPEEDREHVGAALTWVAVDWFRHIEGWGWRVALEHRVYHYHVPRAQLVLLLRLAERLVERSDGVI